MNKRTLLRFLILSTLLMLCMLLMLSGVHATAVVWTDKADYWPWETVTIFGSGFNPNVYYDIPVIKPDGSIVRGDGSLTLGWDTVQADLSGKFTYYYQLDGIEGLYEVRVYNSPWSGSLDQAPLATTTFTEAPPKANLDQVRNGPATAPVSPGDWVNGNAGPSNAHYIEGYSIPYRCVMTDLPTGTPINLTLGYDIKHGGKHAIDYLTHYNRINIPPHTSVFGHANETIDPLIGVTVSTATVTTFPIPAPSSTGSPVPGEPTNSFNSLSAWEKNMTLYGGTINGISYVSNGSLTASKAETQINVNFTVDSSTAVLAWGGHIASRTDWGYEPSGDPRSAGGISGSPYHMRLIDWSLDTLGAQDRSLKSAAVYAMDGSITVIKDAIPDDSQVFTFTSNNFTTFYLDDDGVGDNYTIFSGLGAGTYDFTETVPTGWDLTSIVISDPSGGSSSSGSTATIDLAEGESVVVLFTDTKRGKVTVVKDAVPNDPEDFSYTTGLGASFSLDDDADPTLSNTKVFLNVAPGMYTVVEGAETWWTLTSIDITGDDDYTSGNTGTRTATIYVDPGEEITITFTNTGFGKVTVVKDAVPNDPEDFSYTTGLGASFSLDDDADPTLSNTKVFLNVAPGMYTVVEGAETWWTLTSIDITGDDDYTSGNTGTRTATIYVDPGEEITITFTNTKSVPEGKIIVDKVTIPASDPKSFDFTLTGGPDSISQSFSLTDAAAPHDSGWIKPGTYAASETVPVGWDLTNTVVSDGSPVNAIVLDPGETVTVTFYDTKRGHIIVHKTTVPPGDPADFTFDPDYQVANFVLSDGEQHTSGALMPGTYHVQELPVAGWDLTGLTVTDPSGGSSTDLGTGTATIDLAAGETVHVYYTNTKAPPPPPPVGGVWVPINKFELLAPWIGLASLITAAATSIGYIKRRKRKQI